MKRRDFIRLVAFGTGSFLVPASLIAQSSKSHALIGWLGGSIAGIRQNESDVLWLDPANVLGCHLSSRRRHCSHSRTR